MSFPDRDTVAAKIASMQEPDQSFLKLIFENPTQDDALLVTADPKAAKNAKPFLAKTGLTLNGPVTAIIKADAKVATDAALSWRTKDQPDFLPANLVRFSIPAGTSEQTIALPVDGQAIHVRFNLDDAAEGLRLRSIELRPAKGTPDRSDFSR